ncbi:MAG: HD domain-containing protein [bacterium]|nr:HD domain-containing protein [bacterium]
MPHEPETLVRGIDSELLAMIQREGYLHVILAALATYDGGQTFEHCWRVARGVGYISNLVGWPDVARGITLRAAVLHDGGKLLVPRPIVTKPTRLDRDEWIEMRRHVRIGFEVLRAVDPAAAVVLVAHHECAVQQPDATEANYPRADERRNARERRLVARLHILERRRHERRSLDPGWVPLQMAVAIADHVDALASARWYKPPMATANVRKILHERFPLLIGVADALIDIRDAIDAPVPPLPIRNGDPVPPPLSAT